MCRNPDCCNGQRWCYRRASQLHRSHIELERPPGSREGAMKGHFKLLIAALATAILAGPFGDRLALAQSAQSAPTQTAQLPFALQYEGHITIRADRTATEVLTHRMKILTPSAIAAVSQ